MRALRLPDRLRVRRAGIARCARSTGTAGGMGVSLQDRVVASRRPWRDLATLRGDIIEHVFHRVFHRLWIEGVSDDRFRDALSGVQAGQVLTVFFLRLLEGTAAVFSALVWSV